MNWLDILLGAVLIIRTFYGSKQGIIKGALNLGSSVVGVVLAGNYYSSLSAFFDVIPVAWAADIVAFVLILGCVEMAVALPVRLLNIAGSTAIPSQANRAGGAILGFLMGIIELSGLLAIGVKLFGSGLITESLLAGLLLDRVPLILALLPSEFDIIRDFFG